jgi:hypothetical protein
MWRGVKLPTARQSAIRGATEGAKMGARFRPSHNRRVCGLTVQHGPVHCFQAVQG